LNASDDDFSKIFLCLHGRKEVVVICSEELKNILMNLPSDYFQPKLIDIKNYLKSNNIDFIEDYNNTTIV